MALKRKRKRDDGSDPDPDLEINVIPVLRCETRIPMTRAKRPKAMTADNMQPRQQVKHGRRLAKLRTLTSSGSVEDRTSGSSNALPPDRLLQREDEAGEGEDGLPGPEGSGSPMTTFAHSDKKALTSPPLFFLKAFLFGL